MDAKQELRRYIEALNDVDAERVWAGIRSGYYEQRWGEQYPLSEEQIASVERGLADEKAGRVVSHEELRRRFGLD